MGHSESSVKKKIYSSECVHKETEGIILSEVTQSQKNSYMIFIHWQMDISPET
jgi:hypothetical protein